MGEVRAVRALLVAGGEPFPVLSVDVTQTKDHSSDTFNAKLAMGATSLSLWADSDQIPVQVIAGVSLSGGLLFDGETDKVHLDFEAGIITASGRDKSKKLNETKHTKGFKNKTAEGIVQEIAGKHGLSVDFGGGSALGSQKAGKNYHLNDWVKLSDQHSDWTVVQHLADREGKVAYVHKNVLHFIELDSENLGDFPVECVRVPAGANVFRAFGNFVKLSFDRNLEAGKGTKVKVSSRHTKTAKDVHGEHSDGEERKYTDRHAGIKTKDHADRMARKRHREHTRHACTVRYEGPGRSSVRPGMTMTVSGTGTSLDQPYHIDQAHHAIDEHGYHMALSTKNSKKGKGGK